MAFSVGVWSEGPVAGGTLYRWEIDAGKAGFGFALVDWETGTVRPADRRGQPQGTFAVDGRSGVMSGDVVGPDRMPMVQVAAALIRAYRRDGRVPETAHPYFG
ncbi:hypothetical protein EV385_4117 [Krasilnikovia cinnamomea]|uniref:Uncharacterized protein n=1 Tax=Krasilnikovia cinnamomea TaxID=349313 RepID=A0A4Q7ZPK9_9ACTN|nr:hypothetical protein [Krasilnikovia cinnamomea]RZU52269.1 hypothetical protein EV385_4117 [Krasilnikovia cinnamomea]